MKKRSGIVGSMLVTIIALLVASCGDNAAATEESGGIPASAAASASSSAASAKAGGTLVFGIASTLDTLDTGTTGGDDVFRVARSVFDSLVAAEPDQTIKPWLAESWEISPDRKTYTFRLKQGVKFHDGTPFNAKAVKYNFDRIVDPKSKSVSAVQLLGPYESSEAVDDLTVRVHLRTPFAPLLSNLGKIGFISPAALEKYGEEIGRHVVGTGPFRLAKWVSNSEIELERNPDYDWPPADAGHGGPAYLDKVTIKFIPEEATRVGSLQSKQVSIAEAIPAQNLQAFKTNADFKVLSFQTPGLPYSLFFDTEREPWNDIRVRQAVKYTIDVDAIVKTLYLGGRDRGWSVLSPTVMGYDSSLEGSYQPDPDKANALLDESGWKLGPDGIRAKGGVKLTLLQLLNDGNRDKRQDIAAMIQQQLKKVGIQSELSSGTNAQVNDLLREQKFDLFGMSWAGGDPDLLRMIFHSSNIPTDYIKPNISRLNAAEVDRWLDDAYVETDAGKRAELYKNVQQYVDRNTIAIPIYVTPYTIASVKEVSGLKLDSSGFPLFYDVKIQYGGA